MSLCMVVKGSACISFIDALSIGSMSGNFRPMRTAERYSVLTIPSTIRPFHYTVPVFEVVKGL